MKKRMVGFAVLVVCMMLLTGCAPNPNPVVDTANGDGDIAGFWLGLWHGLIVFFTFIISLFSDKVSIYEIHNSGGGYNFGFLIGAGVIFGGGGSTAASKK